MHRIGRRNACDQATVERFTRKIERIAMDQIQIHYQFTVVHCCLPTCIQPRPEIIAGVAPQFDFIAVRQWIIGNRQHSRPGIPDLEPKGDPVTKRISGGRCQCRIRPPCVGKPKEWPAPAASRYDAAHQNASVSMKSRTFCF